MENFKDGDLLHIPQNVWLYSCDKLSNVLKTERPMIAIYMGDHKKENIITDRFVKNILSYGHREDQVTTVFVNNQYWFVAKKYCYSLGEA